MSLSMPNSSRTRTILSGASIRVVERLSGFTLARSAISRLSNFSGKGGAGFELRISLDHRLQRFLVAAVAAIMVGMVAAQEIGIAKSQRAPVGIGSKAEHLQRLAVGRAELAAVLAGAVGGGTP